jgi:TRAP-type C4-dicarboxylate transport system substrate-binding protein
MNIRVPGANIFIDLYKDYYGANPIAMDFSEVYTSLQQGTIDGQENPISVFESSKLNEVQKYVTLWDAVRDTTIWIINKDKLESLSPENQTIIKDSANEALKWGNDYLANNEEQIISQLEDSGTVFTRLTDEQKEAFKTASEGLYDKYSDEIGQDVIDLFRK